MIMYVRDMSCVRLEGSILSFHIDRPLPLFEAVYQHADPSHVLLLRIARQRDIQRLQRVLSQLGIGRES